ncbi:unnamed protein product [Zymoseptoria tritici ST99CH_1A5]|uniref:Nephrocystin 3-like N-terminal domain-containing protein n=1 Tax=Zymoseptoria tritici ST99CH_1A5 TaxID=1276529 RepID=A0A1Y6LYH1_ZYMTR|nr:unnamed protein product [Zymoseptoria tritici ST99CH_1A5]
MEIDRLFDTEELRLQESYRKELQDSRRVGGSGTNRTSRGDQACQFMLTDATFLDWLSNFSGTANLLAIIGHMGSGKSVLVSFLIEELKRRNRGQIPEPKVCNYYCRDARPGLENRVYSVLLFQLLEQLPWLKEPFLKWYKKEVESGNHPLEDASILEDYLEALCGLLERPLFLVIDGVDECDPDTCRSIITLLRRLSKGNLNVKILLSCRPTQEIVKQLELMLQVHLVASDERDRLIVEHTVHKRLESLSDEVKNEIVRAVSSAAQGSAIWTRMTIESIVKEEITQLRPILSFLQNMSLPGGLADLYKDLLPPATDAVGSRKRKTATVALMILYAARRPLSISELGWATALGTAPQNTTTVSALAVLVDAPRILRLIRPFLAPIDFDDLTKRQIFLVHKSVEEFVLEIVKPPHQHAEKCIFDICVRYLLLDETGHFHLLSEEQILSSELRQATDLFADSLSGAQEYNEDCDWDEWEADETRFDPTESRAGAEHGFGHFFVYASCHWIDHLGALDLENLARRGDIERLCHVGSTWLRNWIEQHRRPDCVLNPRFTFDYSLYDPLSIVALFGSDTVFADMLANSDFKSSSYSAETIENAAAQLRQWGGKTQVTRSRG